MSRNHGRPPDLLGTLLLLLLLLFWVTIALLFFSGAKRALARAHIGMAAAGPSDMGTGPAPSRSTP